MDWKLANEIEGMLRCRRSPLIPADAQDEFVLPSFDGYSLANVPSTIAAVLGRNSVGSLPALDDLYWRERFGEIDHVILFLLDALGYLQLQERLKAEPESAFARMAQAGLLLPMTSICPSTTATALVTLSTAEPPSAHGMLGYELWLREYGVLVEMLGLKPVYSQAATELLAWGHSPETFLPVPGYGTLLRGQGVSSSIHIAEKVLSSALTRSCYRGVDRVIGHGGPASLFANLSEDLRQTENTPSFHYVYWGAIDAAIHLSGAEADDWRLAYDEIAAAFDAWIAAWQQFALPNTLLVVCADHGFVSTPQDTAYSFEDSPLAALSAIPYSGESRFTYLHLLEGASPKAQQALDQALGDDYVIVESQAALEGGLFGPGRAYRETTPRIGHYIAVAKGKHYIDRLGRAASIRGRHGGLTPEEMLVPWLAARADALG